MDESITPRVGLDIHNDSVGAATVGVGCDGEVLHVVRIGGDLASLGEAPRKSVGRGCRLHMGLEAAHAGD